MRIHGIYEERWLEAQDDLWVAHLPPSHEAVVHWKASEPEPDFPHQQFLTPEDARDHFKEQWKAKARGIPLLHAHT